MHTKPRRNFPFAGGDVGNRWIKKLQRRSSADDTISTCVMFTTGLVLLVLMCTAKIPLPRFHPFDHSLFVVLQLK